MLPIYKLNFNRVHIQFNYTLSATNSMVKKEATLSNEAGSGNHDK